MELDTDRVRGIVEADHSFYGSAPAQHRTDERLNPQAAEFIGQFLTPEMHVLDIGCGSGETLIGHSQEFATGVGVDNDEAHVKLAEEAKSASSVANVEFKHLDFLCDTHDLPQFDFVFSERGFPAYSTSAVEGALRVVKIGGLIFFEVIGDLHHQEMNGLFPPSGRINQAISTSEQVRVALERCGVSIRIAADVISKRHYPDVYEWLQWQCSIWAWSGSPLPRPDDERLRLFAEQHTTDDGEIETTHHVVWIGGVKLESSPYWPI